MKRVTVFTDGAAKGNPDGPGGYGAVVQYTDARGQLHEREYSGGYSKTTNNRMELMAAITALEALNQPCEVALYSDSVYLIKAFTEHWIDKWIASGWKRGRDPVKNIGLWKHLTGEENLRLIADIRGQIGREEIRQALQRVGLDPDDKRKYRAYSVISEDIKTKS